MTSAVIIDDEPHARQAIRSIIQLQAKEINILGEAGSVAKALLLIRDKKPQLLFLDIDLPDGNAFDLLKQIEYHRYRIIFITAYKEYAIQAIKFSAFDYILKPVNPLELIQSIKNCLTQDDTNNYKEKFQAFFSNFNNILPGQKKIVLKTAEKIHVVDIKNIIRCESDNVYTTIFTNTEQNILVSKSIKHYDEMLSSYGFMRVHQSHLINVNYISYYNKQYGGLLVMSDNSSVPVSNQKKSILFKYLESL